MKRISADITNYLQNLLGDSYESFIQAKSEPTAMRVNELKSNKKEVCEQLDRWGVNYSPHPVNPNGLILLEDKIHVSHTLLYFTGAVAYQGVASQLPVLALQPQPGETVLEMAASPGSKATQIAALMENRGKLVLNDVSTNRLQALVANCLRCGVMNDVTLNLAGQRLGALLPEFFDRVLLDAPCSALGTLAENVNELNHWWSPRAMKKFANVQQLLLVSAIKAAKVGGTIVYSTCSVAPEENEMLIQKMLENYPVELTPISFADAGAIFPGFSEYQGRKFSAAMKLTCRTFPQRNGMEGFFIARLRKTGAMKKKTLPPQTEWVETEPFDSPNILPVLEQLSGYWGLDIEQFQKFRFLINKKRLWIISADWEQIPTNNFVKTGLALAEKRVPVWKLTNASAQIFQPARVARFLELPKELMRELFRSGKIDGTDYPIGYFALRFQSRTIGIISNFRGALQIHLPHRFNLVL
ncbi:MAG: RsmB/NOP family class I SAM-dependent RNA methyltransferase [Calditrichaeota bacterium]|nr:RsmB/NOP family class I SAM-dependent RNA methyltransferase [Calditrichota bacterium]